MTVQQLLNITTHRPWKLPSERWKFYQEWNNAIFLHWQVSLEELEKHVPKELEIDLFHGKPWVSVVAFTMEKTRLKNLPSFPPVSDFHEINIRTYVKSNNKTGVYFLSIEGGTSLACKVAKGISELPYRYSKIRRAANHYKSYNTAFNDQLDIEFTTSIKQQEKTILDKWLVERYALFQVTETTINEYEIHHLEWPLNQIELQNCHINYSRFNKLTSDNPDIVHFSKGVKVIAWGKQKSDKTGYNRNID